ncbi:MAG TPA: TonB family protein [Bacteriovoracaceae bacterium]|nr:TonB family protein [Bacteriovoracaceae bacterium]
MTHASSDQEFYKSLVVSAVVHILVVCLCVVMGQLASQVFKSNGDVEIIRSAIRVDVVGMPKFTVQELKALEPEAALPAPVEEPKGVKEEVKEAPKEEAADVIKKDDLVIQEEGKKKKKESFLNMLTDYSKKKVPKVPEKKGTKSGTSNKNFESLIIEGNRLSKGSALVGDYSDEENSEFSEYVQNFPALVRQFWKLPSYLMEKDLRCRIRINLSSNGELLNLDLLDSSGQPEYDARAEKAIRDAAPFPKPSEAVGKRLTKNGIILRFPL